MTSIARNAKDKAPRWTLDTANWLTRRYALATAGSRDMPDFLIVGTKRGGTTSLWNDLVGHPQVLGMFPEVRGTKSNEYFFKHPERSLRWYRSHFPSQGARRRRGNGKPVVSGEASPYYMFGPGIPARLAQVMPRVKLIVLLRDPVERAYSHYQERKKEGVEPLDFPAALQAEDRRIASALDRLERDPDAYIPAYDYYSYRLRGIYLPQIQRLQRHFPPGQILITRSEDYYGNFQPTFDQVCDFLGIDHHIPPAREHRNLIERAPMDEAVRQELTRFYQEHTIALEAHLQRQFGWARP